MIQKKQEIYLDDLPNVALKIYKLFNEIDQIDFKYIKNRIDDSESKIKRNLILLQNKKLIKNMESQMVAGIVRNR